MGANFVKNLLRTFIIIIGIVCVLWFIGSRTNRLMIVRGTSMYPTIHSGDVLVLSKRLSYSLNDIIVFKNGDENYVKRIVSTGNHYYALRRYDDYTSYILLDNPKINMDKLSKRSRIYLLNDRYWVRGDGYGSVNSEVYGPVEHDLVLGKVDYILHL